MGCRASSCGGRGSTGKPAHAGYGGLTDSDHDDASVSSPAALASIAWKEVPVGGRIVHANFVATHEGQLEDAYEPIDPGRLLGTGSYGSVFKARCKATGATRAVKVITKRKKRAHNSSLTREIGIMREMDHPNIVKLFEVFEDARAVQLVLELCEGGELFDAITKEGHFSEVTAAILMNQILHSVWYLHRQFICHRDIKPENFLLVDRGAIDKSVLKLIDFGVSKRCGPSEKLKSTVGSPDYMAPEVLRGLYDCQCDVWSVGVTMFAMLSGSSPFCGATQVETYARIRKGEYAFHEEDWKNISEDAKELVRLQLTMSPKKRATAKAAMDHAWIKHRAPKAHDVSIRDARFMRNLQKFRGLNALKQAAVHAIAGQLGEEDIKDLRDLFQALDTSGDGQLTPAEIQDGLQAAQLEVPPDLQNVLASIDSDGSGVIEYTEFLAAALDRRKYCQEDLCWAAFKSFDRDGDGTISPDDLRQVVHEGGLVETMGLGSIENVMESVDSNGDGSIDFDEFMAMMRRVESVCKSPRSPKRRWSSSTLALSPRSPKRMHSAWTEPRSPKSPRRAAPEASAGGARRIPRLTFHLDDQAPEAAEPAAEQLRSAEWPLLCARASCAPERRLPVLLRVCSGICSPGAARPRRK